MKLHMLITRLSHILGILLRRVAGCAVLVAWQVGMPQVHGVVLPTTDGFYGIWYSVGPSGDQYAYKYSGGLGTYMQQTSPLAIHAPAVNRTYFLYGGTNGTNNSLRNYISYYDHTTDLLARPREIRNVGGNDNHKNASLAIDDAGYLNVFGNSHGNSGTGNYYKSASRMRSTISMKFHCQAAFSIAMPER